MRRPKKIPAPDFHGELLAAMSPACRAAFQLHDRTYMGGLGGGWHTAARAFIAAWEARGPTLTEEWSRLYTGDPHYGRLGSEEMNDPARHTLRFWKEAGGFCAVANQVGSRACKTPEEAIGKAIDCAIELSKRNKS